MEEVSSTVGIDVHQKDLAVCVLGADGSVLREFRCPNTPSSVRRLSSRLKSEGGDGVRAVYEAGPCGFSLQRSLRDLGIDCRVVAPSLIPVKPGERIKTDRRDARKLAEYARGGSLTEVHPPSPGDEAVRDLVRCREAAKGDQKRARHRLSKWLLKRGQVYRSGKQWTQRHSKWLRGLSFEIEVETMVFDELLGEIIRLDERVSRLDEKIERLSRIEPYVHAVGALRTFRGIDTLTAMVLISELHDFRRFKSPQALMNYLGLVPSEHTTGETRRLGPITKSGNKRARRVLVEAAWHYRHRPSVGHRLRKRREGQPEQVVAVADKAMSRLHRRYHRLVHGSKKAPGKAAVAVARELAGFVWCVMYELAEDTGTN